MIYIVCFGSIIEKVVVVLVVVGEVFIVAQIAKFVSCLLVSVDGILVIVVKYGVVKFDLLYGIKCWLVPVVVLVLMIEQVVIVVVEKFVKMRAMRKKVTKWLECKVRWQVVRKVVVKCCVVVLIS